MNGALPMRGAPFGANKKGGRGKKPNRKEGGKNGP